jgi:hypothetical protein
MVIAELALSSTSLQRFVFVSTAYVSTHLWARTSESDLRVHEKVYALESRGLVCDEWDEVVKKGTSRAYEMADFPWAYAYAKHLTERLLIHRFSQHGSTEKLLIVRPSIIGPAQRFPFPGYCMPRSSPSTILAAALLLYPHWRLSIATQISDTRPRAFQDEVPVDVVSDRLLTHLATGTYGCIHAVSGARSRYLPEQWLQSLMQLRGFPWSLNLIWVAGNWASSNQHYLCRLYGVFGTSFEFSQDRTYCILQSLSEKEKLDLQLFTQSDMVETLQDRVTHIRYAMDELAKKSRLMQLIILLFYKDFGKVAKSH